MTQCITASNLRPNLKLGPLMLLTSEEVKSRAFQNPDIKDNFLLPDMYSGLTNCYPKGPFPLLFILLTLFLIARLASPSPLPFAPEISFSWLPQLQVGMFPT